LEAYSSKRQRQWSTLWKNISNFTRNTSPAI